MQGALPNRSPTAHARDAARLRLRRLTQASVALMVALGGAFAALAAGSTHTKKTVVRAHTVKARTAILTQAPAPPLVSAHSPASSEPAAPAPPVSAPTQSYSAPVVVSGGS
ncbi:MAG: hypothetical protein WAU41_09420 [Gaiellaceae bacterium]